MVVGLIYFVLILAVFASWIWAFQYSQVLNPLVPGIEIVGGALIWVYLIALQVPLGLTIALIAAIVTIFVIQGFVCRHILRQEDAAQQQFLLQQEDAGNPADRSYYSVDPDGRKRGFRETNDRMSEPGA